MGQDIHVFVEERGPQGDYPDLVGAGGWRIVGGSWTEYHHNDDTGKEEETEHYYGETYHDRNYYLFGILAGTGRAPHIEPIVPPRGLPEDVHPEIRRCSDMWDVDGHSHSWLTYDELVGFDWNAGREMSGEVGPKTYQYWKATGDIEVLGHSYPGFNSKLILESEMEKYIERNLPPLGDPPEEPPYWESDSTVKTAVKWQETWKQTCPAFANFLEYLSKFEKPENLRIVFWFDN